MQEFYQDGKLNEERKEFYDNGQCKMQEFYQDGKREGERKSWYDNGQLYEQEFWRDGKREGERKIWYANGQLFEQEFYRGGKLEGEYKYWYGNGHLGNCYYVRDEDYLKFDLNKKYAMLQVKKWLHRQSLIPAISPHIISDLINIIY